MSTRTLDSRGLFLISLSKTILTDEFGKYIRGQILYRAYCVYIPIAKTLELATETCGRLQIWASFSPGNQHCNNLRDLMEHLEGPAGRQPFAAFFRELAIRNVSICNAFFPGPNESELREPPPHPQPTHPPPDELGNIGRVAGANNYGANYWRWRINLFCLFPGRPNTPWGDVIPTNQPQRRRCRAELPSSDIWRS